MSRRGGHHVAVHTASLGTVLDCTIADGQQRVFVDEWKGYQLLTNATAFENLPGKAKLYFVRGELADTLRDPHAHPAARARKYWTEREPDGVGELETSPCSHLQGRLVRLGYRSDKWHRKGKTEDYDHDFLESGMAPLVYTSAPSLAASRCVVVVGGSMRVTKDGID